MKGGKGPKKGGSGANALPSAAHHSAVHHPVTYGQSNTTDSSVPAGGRFEAHPNDERHGHYHQQGGSHHDRHSASPPTVKGSFRLSPPHQHQAPHPHPPHHVYPALPPPAPPGYHGRNHTAVYPPPAPHYGYHPQAYLPPPHPHQHHQLYLPPPQHPPPQHSHPHPSNLPADARPDHAHVYTESSQTEEQRKQENKEDEGEEIVVPVKRKRGRPRKNPLPHEQQQKQRKKNSIGFKSTNKPSAAELRQGVAFAPSRTSNADDSPKLKEGAEKLAAALAEENNKLHAELKRKMLETEKYKAQAQSLSAGMTAIGCDISASLAGGSHTTGSSPALAAPKTDQEGVEYGDSAAAHQHRKRRHVRETVSLEGDLGHPSDSLSSRAPYRQQSPADASSGGRIVSEKNSRYHDLSPQLQASVSDARMPASHVSDRLSSLQQQRLIQEEQEKQVLRQIAARRNQEVTAAALLGGPGGNVSDDSSFQHLFLRERQFNEELRQELAAIKEDKAKGDQSAKSSKLAKEEVVMVENRRLKGRIRDLEKTLAGLREALGEQEKKTSTIMSKPRTVTEPNPNLAPAAAPTAPTSSDGVEGMLAELRRSAAAVSAAASDPDPATDSAMMGLLKKRLIAMEHTLEQVVNERDAVLRAHQEQQKNLLLLDDEVERQLVKNKTMAAEIDTSHRQLQESTMRRTILVRQLEEACATNDTLEKRIEELESSNALLREQIVRWDEARRGAGG